MPDKTDTLFDQYLSLGTSKDRRCKRAPFPLKQFFQNACHIILEASLFAMSSVLMALGLPLCFFLILSGWDLLGLFTHLDNLSVRYLQADGVRRLAFSSDLKIIFFGSTALIAALRMPGFITRIASDFPERSKT
ncbi:hypothetical protein [Parasphingorhabdus sp.]|uniref:hypothetical protein n=1 Tax=Parasphingorhabdus sp. TaxID=2709688 RepID=UPI003BB02BE5|tara:strand:+ start:33110 stop:33511 length:402 start_codon:yes stop_codon:yes gene_type:complete